MQTAEETKRLKNIEKMYLKRKSYFDMLMTTHENEKRQMQQTIKEQNDKIQLQQRAESTVRDQLSRTGEEIDDSNTRYCTIVHHCMMMS
jgi:septal ring factor EnvC (AmiA/AmiB activator)